MSPKSNTSVLIVGAGPTGLTMALWLRKKGISFRIIDKNIKPVSTSRALALQARTMEFYLQLGIADEILAAGNSAAGLRFTKNNRPYADLNLGETGKTVSRFPELFFLTQDLHEKILIKKLESLKIKIERQTELLQFTQDKYKVEATVKGPAGEETITASYLCGCDGADSEVRHILGIKFFKKAFQQNFFIADLTATGVQSENNVLVSVNRNNFCIMMSLKPANSFRVMGIIPPESENKENLSFVNISDYVIENTGLKIESVNGFSTYLADHRIASHFQHGRAFLVGDAAHIHSPATGQGMNAGIGDAVNLAWKLAEVLKGQAGNKIISSYEPERLTIAEKLASTTDSIFRFMSSQSFYGYFFRNYLLPGFLILFRNFKPFLLYFFKLLSQTGEHYHQSLLSKGGAGSIRAGDRLPWLKTEKSDNYESLSTMEWHIQIYGRAFGQFNSVANFRGFKVIEFQWSSEAAAKGFIKDAFYLIRPDGFIALADVKQNSSILKNYLNDWEIDHSQKLKTVPLPPERELSGLI